MVLTTKQWPAANICQFCANVNGENEILDPPVFSGHCPNRPPAPRLQTWRRGDAKSWRQWDFSDAGMSNSGRTPGGHRRHLGSELVRMSFRFTFSGCEMQWSWWRKPWVAKLRCGTYIIWSLTVRIKVPFVNLVVICNLRKLEQVAKHRLNTNISQLMWKQSRKTPSTCCQLQLPCWPCYASDCQDEMV